MSLRKPFVRFEASARAKLISENSSQVEVEEEEEKVEGSYSTKSVPAKKKKQAQPKKKSKPKKTLVIIKGHLILTVPGFPPKQKIKLSQLVSKLPGKALKQAAKRVLVASGLRASRKKPKSLEPSFFGHG
jgi:hypothetical protein